MVNMNTLCVHQVHYSKRMFALSAGFCRKIIDQSVYNTFMLTTDENPKVFRSPTQRLVYNQQKIRRKNRYLILIRLEQFRKCGIYCFPFITSTFLQILSSDDFYWQFMTLNATSEFQQYFNYIVAFNFIVGENQPATSH